MPKKPFIKFIPESLTIAFNLKAAPQEFLDKFQEYKSMTPNATDYAILTKTIFNEINFNLE